MQQKELFKERIKAERVTVVCFVWYCWKFEQWTGRKQNEACLFCLDFPARRMKVLFYEQIQWKEQNQEFTCPTNKCPCSQSLYLFVFSKKIINTRKKLCGVISWHLSDMRQLTNIKQSYSCLRINWQINIAQYNPTIQADSMLWHKAVATQTILYPIHTDMSSCAC